MSDSDSVNIVHDVSSSNQDMIVLRANLNNAQDAEAWMRRYSKESRTSWLLYTTARDCTRIVYHRVWVCHLNYRNKSVSASLGRPRCPGKLSIKIKKVNRSTKRGDPFLRLNPPLPAIIKLFNHNHSIACDDAPVSMRPLPETRLKFEGYFEMGMNPSEAKRHNERLLGEGRSCADGPANPKLNSLYCWYKDWRASKYGSRENPLPKLTEKAATYATSGADIKLSGTEDSWVVLLITPIMRRAQRLDSSADLIFVDSISSCDAMGGVVTFFFTATKAGAVPIAVFIHKEQDTEGYQKAFDLLRTDYTLCFGKQQHPAAFITDCSAPLKTALLRTWPGARQLLCHVHILQAEWRRLDSSEETCGVRRQERHKFFSSFRKVLAAKSHEEIMEAKQELCQCNYREYTERARALFAREREWALPTRANLTSRNQDMYAYSEMSIRTLRDVLLSQRAFYNAVALLDFVATEWEAHLKARILKHSRPTSFTDHQWGGCCVASLEKLLSCTPDASLGSLTTHREGEDTFSFRNSSGRRQCTIKFDLGLCSCWPGSQGAFCKHQVAVMQEFNLPFPRAPEVTAEECQQFAALAVGSGSTSPPLPSSPTPQMCDLDCTSNASGENVSGLLDHDYFKVSSADAEDSCMEQPQEVSREYTCVENVQEEVEVSEEQSYQGLVSSLRHVHELAKDVPGYMNLVDRIAMEVKELTTSHAAYSFLLRLDASVTAERRRVLAPPIKRPRKQLEFPVRNKKSKSSVELP